MIADPNCRTAFITREPHTCLRHISNCSHCLVLSNQILIITIILVIILISILMGMHSHNHNLPILLNWCQGGVSSRAQDWEVCRSVEGQFQSKQTFLQIMNFIILVLSSHSVRLFVTQRDILPFIHCFQCSRPYKPYIFCEDIILAVCHRDHILIWCSP